MIKRSITYTDFNNVTRTEDFYFHINEMEFAEMHLEHGDKGLGQVMQEAYEANDRYKVFKILKKIIIEGVGVKSPDGKRFIKNADIRSSFEESNAYPALFTEIFNDADDMLQFIVSMMPEGTITLNDPDVLKSVQADVEAGKTPAQIIRERSEAQMQGHNKPQTAVQEKPKVRHDWAGQQAAQNN